VRAAACWAVGADTSGALIFRYLSGAWRQVPAAAAGVGFGATVLDAVSCVSISECLAVGTGTDAGAASERWNGSFWAATATASPSWLYSPILTAVACRTNASCLALGSYENAAGTLGLAERLVPSLTGHVR
jgi:hypothetical protein